MKKAILKDEHGYVLAIYESEKENQQHSIVGKVERAVSWDSDGTPYETESFAEVYIKWDGCSHFWFYGEDANDKESELFRKFGFEVTSE